MRASHSVTGDWDAFEHRATGADCAVVWLERLDCPEEFTRLLSFRARLPLQPLVLVTCRDADNARHLKDVLVDEVVWQHEVARDLWPAVSRARSRGVLARLGADIEGAAGLPPALRRGLVFACSSPRPIHSVSALANVVACDRRTLWRHWRCAVAGRTTLPLQDVLDWMLLVRARARKSADVSWRVVSEELDVHEHTVARLAHRLVRRSLRVLAAQPVAALHDEFRVAVLAPLAQPMPGVADGDPPETSRDSLVSRETGCGCHPPPASP